MKEELIKEIEYWMDRYSYPFRNQEDLVESRTNWEDLRDAAESAYYLLETIQEKLSEL